ncbi:MAG: acyltransferase [Ferruginibacter sp.]
MMKKVNKVIKDPVMGLAFFSRFIFTILFFPFRMLMYKHIGFLTYISMRSAVRNHSRISIGNHSQINPFVTLWPLDLQIGHHTQVNPGTAIYGKVSIGNHVMIAPNCMLAGGSHNYDDTVQYMMYQHSKEKGITIEDDVWIGANSTILDGVTIGKGAIVGANSIFKDVAGYSIAVTPKRSKRKA